MRLINLYANKCGGISSYESLQEIVEKVDRFIDICNNIDISPKREWKGREMIDIPTHHHLDELFEIFIFFAEWKKESGKNKTNFISWQSYQDMAWLVFGLIGKVKTYLKEDKSRTMVQRREGTDDCEHDFAGIRSRNSRPSALDARQYTAKRSGHRNAHWNVRGAKNNSGGSNVIYTDEILAPLTKKSKRKVK